MGSIPLFVILLAHFFLPDEKLSRMKAVGFVIGFIGLMIVLGPEKLLRFEGQGMALIGEAGGRAAALEASIKMD